MDATEKAIEREIKNREKLLKVARRAQKLVNELPEEQRKGIEALLGTPEEIDQIIQELEKE